MLSSGGTHKNESKGRSLIILSSSSVAPPRAHVVHSCAGVHQRERHTRGTRAAQCWMLCCCLLLIQAYTPGLLLLINYSSILFSVIIVVFHSPSIWQCARRLYCNSTIHPPPIITVCCGIRPLPRTPVFSLVEGVVGTKRLHMVCAPAESYLW